MTRTHYTQGHVVITADANGNWLPFNPEHIRVDVAQAIAVFNMWKGKHDAFGQLQREGRAMTVLAVGEVPE